MNRLALLSLPLLAVLAAALPPAGAVEEKKLPDTLGTIERLDPMFDKLIAPGVKLEVLANGFEWTEGPVWIKDGGYLLFSDIPNNRIVKYQEGKGTSDFLKPSGYLGKETNLKEPGSNGLLLDPQGRLIMMQHGERRVARLEKDGKTMTTLADRWDGKRLNSPNDGVYHSNGDLYFTDPPYGLPKNWDDPTRELDFCGVYRISKDGKVQLLTKDMTRPNGIAFSLDEKTLYVANSDKDKAVWMAFDVKDDGTLGKSRVFYDVTALAQAGKKLGLPDGMKIDVKGNLFATGPGGVWVFTPEGKHLGNIDPGVATANCAFGEDGTVLYLAANNWICRVPTTTKGK
jgi:gluconolactonase